MSVFIFVSCDDVPDTGVDNYLVNSSGAVLHIKKGATVSYYLDGLSSVDAKYTNAMKKAISKANSAAEKITIGVTTKSNSNWYSYVTSSAVSNADNAYATNYIQNETKTGVITQSKIVFEYQTCSVLSEDELTHVSLHEIGHTLGLMHYTCPEDKIEEYSDGTVMLESIPVDATVLTDYTKFDKENIKAMYKK